jgi:L-cysteine S-thiosulfotransferase
MRSVFALLLAAAAGLAGAAERRSGFDDLSPATQALQRDDTQNPAMLWHAEGQRLWHEGPRACASCHGTVLPGMRGVAARYPAHQAAHDAAHHRVFTLGQRINQCRVQQQRAAPWPAESEALQTLIGHASRGLPIAPARDAALLDSRQRGQALWQQRLGQLDLSCAMCHERLAGQRLAGSVIPQGHPTGYPIYRLEWQGMGSLQRRIRGCLVGVRAEPWDAQAQEWVDLEVFLMHRAAGMPLETPAVRP